MTNQLRLPLSLWRFALAVRQWRFPKEFRIAPAVWPPDLIEAWERLADSLASAARQLSPSSPHPDHERLRMLAELGVGLWRLRQKMVEPGTERPREEMRRAYRHLESVWDVLAEAGVSIQDHTQEAFDPGMSLRVIAFQPVAGLRREQVIETIKPTIYYQGQIIQMGEVIVGAPENSASDVP